jgi:NAD(P)-dependent dehydrogenase (short-subunit alcohol dehydrogenase family)
MAPAPKRPMGVTFKQSPPVDFSKQYSAYWLKGKHILITGAASGFGLGFVKEWASAGASVVIADINAKKGEQIIVELKKECQNENIWFVKCDVRVWAEQVAMFEKAVKWSPHGGIDIVVANAGVAGIEPFGMVNEFNPSNPVKPDYRVMDVNLYGVLYTSHLALYYLPRNPGSKACSVDTDPINSPRDRMLLLVGSMASIAPIPSQPLYGSSKHAVLGLFRNLRAQSYVEGVRVNMIAPYFIDTGIIPVPARIILAGGATGKVEDVVDAATRLTADSSILGRCLVIGPKVRVKQLEDGEWEVLPKNSEEGEEKAVWEAHADDFDDSDTFMHRIAGVLNGVAVLRGWQGWATDVLGAFRYGIFGA